MKERPGVTQNLTRFSKHKKGHKNIKEMSVTFSLLLLVYYFFFSLEMCNMQQPDIAYIISQKRGRTLYK